MSFNVKAWKLDVYECQGGIMLENGKECVCYYYA